MYTYTHETQGTQPNHPESHTHKHTHKHTVKFTFINTHTPTSTPTPTNTHTDSITLICTHPHPHTHLLMFNVTDALNELHVLCVRLPALLPQLLHLCSHFLHLPLKASTICHQRVHRLVHLYHHHSQTHAGQHQHNMQSGPHEKSFWGNLKNIIINIMCVEEHTDLNGVSSDRISTDRISTDTVSTDRFSTDSFSTDSLNRQCLNRQF